MGTTRGLVGGISKGLVGMVAKPLGGAAELVANTGEGLLTGAGWVLAPKPLQTPPPLHRTDSAIRLAIEVVHLPSADGVLFVASTLTSTTALLVLSADKVFLLLDSFRQCFSRNSLQFIFQPTAISIYSSTSPENEKDKIDQELLDKIKKMFRETVVDTPDIPGHSQLIASLPLHPSHARLLQNVLSS